VAWIDLLVDSSGLLSGCFSLPNLARLTHPLLQLMERFVTRIERIGVYSLLFFFLLWAFSLTVLAVPSFPFIDPLAVRD